MPVNQPSASTHICLVLLDYQPKSHNRLLRKHWTAVMEEKESAYVALESALANDWSANSWFSSARSLMMTTLLEA